MSRTMLLSLIVAVLAGVGLLAMGFFKQSGPEKAASLDGRVVAVGIPGAGPVSAVGRFLPGGPINDKDLFRAFTAPGKMLDPKRVLVGSSSNFGAPRGVAGDREGSILSIDASSAEVLQIPDDLGREGDQSAAADGGIQLLAAQSPAFLNAVNNPSALTASLPGVSNMLDLSINNAFGRIWPANAPQGLDGEGTSTILDPNGQPLAGAPDLEAGGVFAGAVTNRRPQQMIAGGLVTGAVGTALLGRAIDDPRRAVFAVVTADGSIAQAQTEKGVDGLAPALTISDLRGRANSDELHVGAIVAYEEKPDPILFVSDPVKDEVVAITVPKDDVTRVRRTGAIARFTGPAFDMPVDLAPTVPEAADKDWSSNTTMSDVSDIYVLNRGNNTITRMREDGKVIATRKVLVDGHALGGARVNGMATSSDGNKIYISVTGKLPGYDVEGALLELPAFTQ